MQSQKLTIDDVNRMSREDYGALVGPFFEATPGIVERSFGQRPFDSLQTIYFSLFECSLESDREEKMALLRNYPDFILELRVEGTNPDLEPISNLGGGLDSLSPEDYSRIFHLNGAYRGVYGIPFILYLPEHDSVESIFESFALRLQNRREEELDVATREAMKFAWLRLNLFVHP